MQPLSNVRIVLVLMYLFGIYLSIKLPPGSALAPPATIAGLAAFVLFFLNLGRIQKNHLVPIVFILFIAFITVLFSPEPKHYFVDRMKGVILFSYTLALVYVFFLEVSCWSRQQLSNLFLFFIMFILVGCTLENYFGLKSVSDAFRLSIYDSGVYDGDVRDMQLSGMIRPKLFTSEPSHVGKFLTLSLTAWLAFSNYRWRYMLFLVFFTLGFFLIRSPMVLMAMPIAFLTYFFLERDKHASMHDQLRFVFSIVSLVLIGVLIILTFATTILSNRIKQTGAGHEDSFSIRILTPAFVTAYTLEKSPLFGAGISGSESIWSEIRKGLKSAGVARADDMQDLDKLLKNIFFMHWIYYGLIGGIFMIYAIYYFMRALAVKDYIYCFLVAGVFANTMAGPYMPRFWTFFITFMLVSYVLSRDKERELALESIINSSELIDAK